MVMMAILLLFYQQLFHNTLMVSRRLRHNQQGFHIIVLLVVVVVLGVIGFAGYMVLKKNDSSGGSDRPKGEQYSMLAACGKQPLTRAPADLTKLEQIAPLGGLNPPDHTLPTDHMYMMYEYGDSTLKEVYAPAKIVVTGISFGTEHEGERLLTSDYSISFYPCQELKVIYGHIDTISEKLLAAVKEDFDAGTGCSSSTQGPHKIKHCNKEVDITIPAGEVLGATNGWDLWATYDGFISPAVTTTGYYHNVDAVCPLDYFTDEIQSQLYVLVKRTAQPRCGEAYQDKANTLQGGWFAHQDPEKGRSDWTSQMALVHHSVDNVGMLAIAGTILPEDYMVRFTPKQNGTVNREPSQTRAGVVYCYQHEGEQRMPNGYMAGTGKILLKLQDNHTMQIERQDGACGAGESLRSPTTYYR